MILIIAEKPSLARNIVEGTGIKMVKKSGYFEGGQYIVSWAFGHLFSLADIEDYSKDSTQGKVRWTMDNLPCFPEKFKFNLRKDAEKRVDSGVQRQFETIKSLCKRADVDTIVNAGDSDREGEIIIRTCVMKAFEGETAISKRLMRLWLPDQTPQTVKEALDGMKEESEYDNLSNEGYARMYTDWLYGVNLTRYATLKTGSLLRVGRVIIPIVKAIYDRDMKIKNFIPDKYYVITSKEKTNGETIELTSKSKFAKEEIEQAKLLCEKYNQSEAIVKNIKKKKDILAPGKLFSLSKLQNILGKKYKMPMGQSLEIVQKLYEQGYVTYPRTNSEYLSTNEQDKIKQIIQNVKGMGYPVEFKNKKTIFDDSKIEAHSALTPTYKVPSKNHLSEDEFNVYSTIFRRFVAVFCSEDCVINKSEIKIAVGDYEEFLLKGTVIVERGWTKYDDSVQKDKMLPALAVNDMVNIDFKPQEKETTPPKHYTIETLNNYLKNPFREEKASSENNENDDEDYKAMFEGLELGTEATRTGIIDNARKSEYIQLKKDVYTIMPNGEFLIQALMRMKINMDKYKTAELGKALKSVYHNETKIDDAVALAKKEISEVFEKKQLPPETDYDDGFYMQTIGKCPLCGEEVVRTKFGYGCRGYKNGCKFTINAVICDRVISKANVKMLLETGKTSKIQGFVSRKSGKSFDALLALENGKVVFKFE